MKVMSGRCLLRSFARAILVGVLWQFKLIASNSPCLFETTKCIEVTKINCTDFKYRTMDGSCNNAFNPSLGMAFTNYNRLLPSKYGDGLSTMRASSTGKQLPSARLLSYHVFGRTTSPDRKFTLLNMQWGQLVTHDISLQLFDGFPGKPPLPEKDQTCCSLSGKYIPKTTSLTCEPIPVPRNDPFFSDFECINFVRTLTDKAMGCPGSEDPMPAEHPTGVTHFLDLSLVYGNSIEEGVSLRHLKDGLLKTYKSELQWPPRSVHPEDDCSAGIPGGICYMFGDIRANQHPSLTAMQIVFLREHNRIASELAKLNKHWNDETLFQEARRINIAQYQHITYHEWLPNLYGAEAVYNSGLAYTTRYDEHVDDYNSCLDPRSIVSFVHSVFRFFHSQIMGHIHLVSESRRVFNSSLRLSTLIDKPGIVEEELLFESFIRGLTTQAAKLTDSNFNVETAENFVSFDGMRDLRSVDIQRDRDHGLPTYNEFREYCGLKRATSWKDYLDLISRQDVRKLQSIYDSYEDVELSIGGALERFAPEALVGPTFLCISLLQFRNLRSGDRYFFENSNQPHPFTRDQLIELRGASAGRLLCDNTNIDYMQQKAFRTLSGQNRLMFCSRIPKVDLSLWREA